MSRKRKAPVRKVYPDPKFHSEVISKFINSIMYDGKRSTAEKILYDALEKIKSKNNEDPLKIFNTAISNVKPNLECRSRRVGGATYQVPVEVKSKRAQALALRWIMDATRKRKNKTIRKLKLPLIMLRSKSGCAHVYLFMKDFTNAVEVQKVMKKFANCQFDFIHLNCTLKRDTKDRVVTVADERDGL